MSFETYEESRTQGQPVNLFKFVYGTAPTAFFACTSAEQPITRTESGVEVVYQPVAVERGNINSSGNLDKSAMVLRFQRTIELVTLYRVYPPSRPVTLIIREGHADDPDEDFPVVWSGRVLSLAREGNEAVVSGEPVSSSMRRSGLRHHYQIGCPRALFLPGCNADKPAATVTRAVEAIGTTEITLPADWNAHPTIKYYKGTVEWTTPEGNTEIREILRIPSARVLSLSGLVRGLSVGQSVEVTVGCNHRQDDCQNLHVEAGTGQPNINNYGGCDWIPHKNPVGLRNNFY